MRILKLLKLDIASPISTLINRSFEMGIFPTLLKTSKVIPIFKNKGSPMNVSNYRPISLLSNIERIYEKVMYSRLIAFLDSHNLIYARQFGFRKGHLTVHALIDIIEPIRKCLDKGEFFAVYLKHFILLTIHISFTSQKLFHHFVPKSTLISEF